MERKTLLAEYSFSAGFPAKKANQRICVKCNVSPIHLLAFFVLQRHHHSILTFQKILTSRTSFPMLSFPPGKTITSTFRLLNSSGNTIVSGLVE